MGGTAIERRAEPSTLRASRHATPSVSRLALADALALGAETWDALAPGGGRSPFCGWAWHRAWADAAPREELAQSHVLVASGGDGAIRALVPVRTVREPFRHVRVPVVTWAVGDVGCPDHLDLLAAPDADLERIAAALEALEWQVLLLGNLADDAYGAALLAETLARRGHITRRRPLWHCPGMRLPESWDAYLATLTPTRRQRVRRTERNLHRRHTATLTDFDAASFDEGWHRLLRLHGDRWSGAGAFRDPRAERLQRAFAGALARAGRLWLVSLELDGEPAAAWYGFTGGDTVYFYQSGRGRRWAGEGVGHVLMGMMIRRAIERGFRRFDFLRGRDEYKLHWTGETRRTWELAVFRHGWRGRALGALDRAAQGAARLRTAAGAGGGVS